MSSIQFLNDFCSTLSENIQTDDFGLRQQKDLDSLQASDWINWLENQDGRQKLKILIDSANQSNNRHIIARMVKIAQHVISISNEQSTLTDPLWESIKPKIKQELSPFMTLPYPYVTFMNHDANNNDKETWTLEFIYAYMSEHENINALFKDLVKLIDCADYILRKVTFKIEQSVQMTKFVSFVLQSILTTNFAVFSSKRKRIFSKACTSLFFILFNPTYYGKIEGLKTFIYYMTDITNNKIIDLDSFTTDKDELLIQLNTFAKSANAYLNIASFQKENLLPERRQAKSTTPKNIKLLSSHSRYQIEIPNEEKWWDFVLQFSIIEIFRHKDNTTLEFVNQILREQEFFKDKLLECAQNNKKSLEHSIRIWDDKAVEEKREEEENGEDIDFKEYYISKNLNDFDHVAQILYENIGVPCLDILKSDEYVNSLPDTDKEIIAIWSSSSSFFRNTISGPSISFWEEIGSIKNKKWFFQRLRQILLQAPKTSADLVFYKNSKLANHERNAMEVALYEIPPHLQQFQQKILVPKNSNILVTTSVLQSNVNKVLLMPTSELVKMKIVENGKKRPAEVGHNYNSMYMLQQPQKLDEQFEITSELPFVYKSMSVDEFCQIFEITGRLEFLLHLQLHPVSIMDNLLDKNNLVSMLKLSYDLIRSIRIWQILNCGFGDLQLAINDFFKVAFYHYSKSPRIESLTTLKQLFDDIISKKTDNKYWFSFHEAKYSYTYTPLRNFIKRFGSELQTKRRLVFSSSSSSYSFNQRKYKNEDDMNRLFSELDMANSAMI